MSSDGAPNQSRSRASAGSRRSSPQREGSETERFDPSSSQDEGERRTELIERLPGVSRQHQEWLQRDRGLDPEIAEKAGCFTGTIRFASGNLVQAFVAPCIVDDVETSWQARFDLRDRPMKGFVSGENSRLNLYFAEQVRAQDPWLCDFRNMGPMKDEDPSRIVVINEGQLDALSSRAGGFVGVSLPNGCKALEWIEKWAPLLANCRRVVVWLDNEAPGTKAYEDVAQALERMRSELWGNIYYVVNPTFHGERIKDANEALKKGGVELVRKIVRSAKSRLGGQYNIRPSKLYHPVTRFPTGIDWIDSRLVLCTGEHTAMIGRANRGKSRFANFWAYMAARHCGEQVYFQSFETVANGELSADLAEAEVRRPIEDILSDPELYNQALTAVQQRVVALEPSLVPRSKDPMGAAIARMIEQASEGVRIHVLDNYAMVQTLQKNKDANAQTREDILEVNDVCRRYDVACIIVYHARKGDARWTIKNLPPDLEDASGSASIGNHCCLGVSVERVMKAGQDTNELNVAVRKARRKVHGRRCDSWGFLDLMSLHYEFGGDGFTGIDLARKKEPRAPGALPSKDEQEDML
jgi:hypothetical protein